MSLGSAGSQDRNHQDEVQGRWTCRIFGHRFVLEEGANVAGPATCGRCGFRRLGISWPHEPSRRSPTTSVFPAPCLTIQPGPFLFEFTSYDHWVDTAQAQFRESVHSSTNTICLDAMGRTCWRGKDFMQARDEGTFPVRVYSLVR